MFDNMPMELVGAVLQTAAELYLESDRVTVMNITRSCSVGYTFAIPVLYRTLVIEDSNSSLLAPVFDTIVPFTSGLLSRPATERLCVHVRRLFLNINQKMDVARFSSLFPQLQAIYTFSNGLTKEISEQLPSSVRSFHTLSAPQNQWVPSSVTRLCIYWYFGNNMITNLTEWLGTSVSNNVTHVALELNDALKLSQEMDCTKALRYLLARDTTAPVVIRLYRKAVYPRSLRVMLRAIGNLDATHQQRVYLWRDKRRIRGGIDDISTSKWDSVGGRTPWSEATPVTQTELEMAMTAENSDPESSGEEDLSF